MHAWVWVVTSRRCVGVPGSWVYGATAAMSSVSANFLLWSRSRLQPQAPAAVEGGSGAASTAGGGRPPGRPRRPGGALCPRARSVLLVPVLWLRSAKTPEPWQPDSATRGSAGTSGQPRAQESHQQILVGEQGQCPDEREVSDLPPGLCTV